LQLVLETVLNTIVSEAKPAFYSDLWRNNTLIIENI
jgi:hypothetical protein